MTRVIEEKRMNAKLPARRRKTAAVLSRDAPCMTLDTGENGAIRMQLSGEWDELVDAIGSVDVSGGLLNQIAALGVPGKRADTDASNFVLGFLDSMQPRDATEALLMTQMATIHQAMMLMATRLNQAETVQQQEASERAMNKLARTYGMQVEALKRYRSKGEQVVRVERVTVESGAQAVVGIVSHGERGDGRT